MRFSHGPRTDRRRSTRRANDPMPRGARWVQSCSDANVQPAVNPYYWLLAATQRDVDTAQWIRWKALVQECGIPAKGHRIPREVSDFDQAPTAHHVVVFHGDEPSGTLRVSLPNFEFAEAMTQNGLPRLFGLEDEDSFDLASLWPLRDSLCEVARVALISRFRKGIAFSKLLAGLVVTARKERRRWLFGTVDCATSRTDDGDLVYRVAAHKKLVNSDYVVTGRWGEAGADDLDSVFDGASFYDDDQRARAAAGAYEGLPLPPAIETFASALGARIIGRPARHVHFEGRLVIPMLADLSCLPPATHAVFGRHPAGLRPATPTFTKKF